MKQLTIIILSIIALNCKAQLDLEISIKNNYIYIHDLNSNILVENPLSIVVIRKKEFDSTEYTFYQCNGADDKVMGQGIKLLNVPFSEIRSADGSFTTQEEFEDWYTSNTGAGASTGNFLIGNP